MLKHIYLILIATFIFGFIAGFVLWLFNHTGDEASPTSVGIDRGLVIAVRSYGGCDSVGCASYRITEDGTYTHIVRPNNEAEIKSEGTLSTNEIKTIRDTVKNTKFDYLSSTKFVGTCPIAFDGLAYEYTIEYGGKNYSLDSCTQDLKNAELFKILNQYFIILQNKNRST